MTRTALASHAKMLLRIEIAGTLINSYDTYDRWLQQNAKEGGAFPLDYWLGGLITGGLAFQPSGAIDEGQEFDAQIGRWMSRYRRYGHAVEDGVRTLRYDAGCCHIQGTCEWVACRDVVASRLVEDLWASTWAHILVVHPYGSIESSIKARRGCTTGLVGA